MQTTTTRWPAQRLIAAGLVPTIAGLNILVAPAWTSPASLALFLVGGAVTGLALQQLSPRVTLLIFAAIVGAGFLAAAPVLAGAKTPGRARKEL